VAPTLLDMAGIAVPDGVQGRSFAPLLRGERKSWQDDVFVQVSETVVGRSGRTRRWKYGVEAPGKDPKLDSCSERYREKYLYDLELDPYELWNLAGHESHRKVADRMKERLIRRMVEAGEEAPDVEDAPKVDTRSRHVNDEETRR